MKTGWGGVFLCPLLREAARGKRSDLAGEGMQLGLQLKLPFETISLVAQVGLELPAC